MYKVRVINSGLIVKPDILAFFFDRLQSSTTNNNDTRWPKVKSVRVEMGHNSFTPRAITRLIVGFMRGNFL